MKTAGTTPHPGGRRDMIRAQLLCRLDRYFFAAGVGDERERAALIAQACDTLLAPSRQQSELSWLQVIGAVDRVLAERHAIETPGDEARLTCRGRIAEIFSTDERSGGRAAESLNPTADWGTPPRNYRAMPDQDLSVRSPRLSWLVDPSAWPSTWRPAHNFVVSLSCLAVVLIP
ncbi:hypothetical protein [Pelagibius sp.]|uniref:hypothetical protein n=1 Tax=Pelagibius sp. TaxID=1931238 RepID=UPI0026265427|nr:hypothetical protein [Pelagibius sp.]